MISALIFIIILGLLILVHELGHFVMAKRAGMKVEEFGLGFPPRIFGIKKGDTTYSLNWIPFGGFVKILGESGEEKDNPKSFASKKPGVKAKVIVAGVIMNILFAAGLLMIGNAIGLRTGIIDENVSEATDVKVQLISVSADSPAELANIRPLDEIVSFKDEEGQFVVKSVEDVQNFVKANMGKDVTILIRRGDELIEKTIRARANPPNGEGALGIALTMTGVIKYPWYKAIYKGVTQTAYITSATFVGYGTIIKNIFTTGSPGISISGPVGIAVFTGQAAKLGFLYLLQFTAFISINLAILNIIPFPALDGGRLLFIIIEKIKRKPVSKKIENTINAVGFMFLIILMIYITTKDVINLF